MSALDHPARLLAAVPDDETTSTTPTTLTVTAWHDPARPNRGFDPRSEYVERFWLGVVGPSVVFLIRRLARGLDELPGGFTVSFADTARAIGLSSGTGRSAPMNRTIDRACMFSTMRRPAPDRLEVRTHLPTLTERQLNRLPLAVRATHDSWLAGHDRSLVPPPAA